MSEEGSLRVETGPVQTIGDHRFPYHNLTAKAMTHFVSQKLKLMFEIKQKTVLRI